MREYLMAVCQDAERRRERRAKIRDEVLMVLCMFAFAGLWIAGWIVW